MLVRAYTYIRTYGPDGLLHVAQSAILNANYLKHELATDYEIAYPQICQHEFVATAERQKDEYGVTALDIAKRILDFGMYAPTIYFPLIVHEALMIEPTETETRETLDYFVSVMRQIAEEARTNPEIVKTAPHTTPVGRLDPGVIHAGRASASTSARWRSPLSPRNCCRRRLRSCGFQPLSGPRGVADDLKKFPGASPAVEKQLNDLGIFHVWQIAELSPVAAHNIGEEVGLPGRVESWIARAKEQMGLRPNNCHPGAEPTRPARSSRPNEKH